MFPKQPLTDQQRLTIAIKQAERSVLEWNQKVRDARIGKFEGKKEPKSLPYSVKLKQLVAQREAAKQEVKRLKELANPKRSPEQIAVDNKRKRLERAIADMQNRMKTGNFSKKPASVVDISKDMPALRAQAEYIKVAMDFAKMKEKVRRENRTLGEVLMETGAEIAHTQKNLMSSFDISAPLRQGGLAMYTNPIIWLRALKPMFQSMSAEKSMRINAEIFSRENAKNGVYERSGLALSKGDGTGNFTQIEDAHRLDLAGKIPGVNASNRSYATFLNRIRADMFDKLLANSKDPKDLNPEKIKAIAAGVNEMTGRGDVGRHAETMALAFWAPRFMKSSFDVLTLKPLRSGTPEARMIFAKQYAKILASLGIIYAVASLFRRKDEDDKIEWNPTSSKFGAIKFGNYTVNPIGFVRPMLVFLARSIAGTQKTETGTVKLREHGLPFASAKVKAQKVPYGGGYGQTFFRFLQSKAHPTTGAVLSLFTGKDFGGKEITPVGMAKDVTIPLSPRQAWDTFKTEDPDGAVVLSLLNFMGGDVKPDYTSPAIMREEAGSRAEYRKKLGGIVMAGTSPSASPGEIALMKKALKDMSYAERRSILSDAVRAAKGKLEKSNENGTLTSYGRRVERLNRLNE
jgi:hypothetical protein